MAGKTLAAVRRHIKHAEPEAVKDWKGGGIPVWSHAEIVLHRRGLQAVVKMTFGEGACARRRSSGLFDAEPQWQYAGAHAIDLQEGDKIDERRRMAALIWAAEALKISARIAERAFRILRMKGMDQ